MKPGGLSCYKLGTSGLHRHPHVVIVVQQAIVHIEAIDAAADGDLACHRP